MKREYVFMENNEDGFETESEPTTPNTPEVEIPNQSDLTEAIQKARKQEKDKLYPQLEKLQEEISILRKEREEQAAREAEKQAKRHEREAQRLAEKKAQEEDEMSFKQLLKTKEDEWAAKLEAERQERERTFALLQREREYQELDTYRRQRIDQERDNVLPELLDLIQGGTKDEIEQSVLVMKDRSAKILDSVASVAQQSRKEQVGTRITVPASGPLDNNMDQRSYTPEDISKMPMDEYIKNRSKLLGNSNNRGQGLFGN
jgi:hypothetical protein